MFNVEIDDRYIVTQEGTSDDMGTGLSVTKGDCGPVPCVIKTVPVSHFHLIMLPSLI